ncbi:MAG: hypothetical protein ACYSUQ_11440 [Planctomycetota bacterium]|jgi:hypothetical protein
MREKSRRGPVRLIVLGSVTVLYGVLLGPGIGVIFGRGTETAFHVVCVALGLLAVVCGVIRFKQWAD